MKNLFVIALSAAMIACCGADKKAGSDLALFEASAFDTVLDGKPVSLYTIKNDSGMTVQITNFGARMVALWVPSADSTFKDVVWGYESIDAYLKSTDLFCGPIVGRYGNRIGKGQFSLDDKKYQLTLNNNGNHLHGGTNGLWSRVWTVEPSTDSTSVKMTYVSPDGEEGYPGEVTFTVVYSVSNANELSIAYTATTTAPTIVNPTSHSYFNLHGTSAQSTNSHVLMINADAYTPTDAGLIPTGVLESLTGSPLDFRIPTAIGARLDTLTFEPMIFAGGYDHNYVLNKPEYGLTFAAEVYEPATGIVMKVLTDQPGLQFYSGNFMDGVDTGKRGDKHTYRTGIALETQNFPDAPNQPQFPSAVLRPGETYKHLCVYAFSVKK